jgi:hypothetical protein
MCMFVVFARKYGASRLIYIPKRTPTRFTPPLCFLLACFRCCLGQGESKIPPSNPHKDHAWHSTLLIQCWPYSSFLMPCAVVCSRGHISEPPPRLATSSILSPCSPSCTHVPIRIVVRPGCLECTNGLAIHDSTWGRWGLRRIEPIAWFGVTGLSIYQSCHITDIFSRTYQLVLTPWRLDFVI